MPVVAWKKVYETGIVALDNEHKKLLGTGLQLLTKIRNRQSLSEYFES